MQRRSFVKKSLISGTTTALIPAALLAGKNPQAADGREWYELRKYTLQNASQQQLVESFYRDAAIPAFNRLGVHPVGVFTELQPASQTGLFVLLPFSSLAHIEDAGVKLEADEAFKKQAEPYLQAPASSPAYERIESSLLKAFKHMPKLAAPAPATRMFELRQYQSASEAAGEKKISMFNDLGEIDIFHRLGFNPVFWGETVIGPLRPNLTYMVSFTDLASKEAHWKSFGADAQWKKISSIPAYADALLVNKITSTLLQPTAYSQI